MVLWLYDIAGSYQAGFNVATAKREGFVGGVCKITEGLSKGADWDKRNKSWAREWYKQSVDEGMFWGGYHYIRLGNGAQQAGYFLDELNAITGNGANGCIVQLDNEADADWQTTYEWSNEFQRLTHDHKYLMYTGAWWWNVAGRRWNGYSLTPYLWDSHYVSGNGFASNLYESVPANWWVPNYGNWPTATFLQFSSKGSCGGLVANVDVNAFRGSVADLLILSGGKMADIPQRVVDALDAAFASPYNTTGDLRIHPQSWMALAIEHGVNAALAQLEDTKNEIRALDVPGVDLDALADKCVEKLLARLALVQKPF